MNDFGYRVGAHPPPQLSGVWSFCIRDENGNPLTIRGFGETEESALANAREHYEAVCQSGESNDSITSY